MRKLDIIEGIMEMTGLPRREVDQIVYIIIDEIITCLARGEKVKITGLGTFHVRHKKKRIGRNPKTGEEAEICERNVISFRPSVVLKRLIKY